MQKDYLKYLISISKKFSKNKDIFDIVIYGSSIKGKINERDVDVLVIFKEKSLNERIEIVQKIKETIKEKIKNIDLKTINLSELFEREFLARQAILSESYSLIYKIPFSERMGFENYILFTYSLKNLNHNEKTKFVYSLIGRNREGILQKLKAKSLGKATLIIPIENSIIFEEFLQKWKIKYNKKNIMISKLQWE